MNNMDARVHDFVDDKLQSAADLDSLDALLESVKAQQQLLKQQLDDARREYADVDEAARKHAQSMQQRARAFQEEQDDIDRRLLIVTQSETSDDAVHKFEGSMAKLRKLDVAAGYVELLQEVDTLRSTCIASLGKDDDAALKPYGRLQQLATSLRSLQDVAEGAAPHLLDHVHANVQELRHTIQTAFAANLDQTLKKMNWPKSTDRVPLALEDAWARDVGRLLDLQKPELEDREHDSNASSMNDPPVLLALEVLVHPLDQRFTYHFSGNKPTNRLDKPEYFLNHVIDLIATYADFIQDNIQPLLLRHFRRSDLALTPAYIDATTAFITSLIPTAKNKVYAVAGQVADQPSLLSHLVQEVIQFDKTLEDSYGYTPYTPSIAWRGLSGFLLDTSGYFQKWLDAERNFALQRYQAIVGSPEAGEIDYDAVTADATKPTKAAIRVNDLLETVTERYRHLSSFSQKIRFLIDIQIEIFDQYYRRLSSSLEAYLTLNSTVGRTMHGMSGDEAAKVQGVKGLDRLCRVFGSSDYLEHAMRDWSDDVFFLELWAELDHRSKTNDRGAGAGSVGTWHEVQQKTSSVLGAESEGGLQGALFDETASSYHRLRVRSETVLVETLTYNARQALKPYSSIATWASLSTTTAGSAVSAELDPALRWLDDHFAFLRRALGRAPLRRLVRHVCHAIQAYLWDHVLLSRAAFSAAGAAQLAADLRALCAAVDRFAGPGQARIGLRKLLEGVTLLGLPVRGEIVRVQRGLSGAEEDEEAAAWDDGDGDVGEGEGGQMLSLFQAERLVFQDNEGARQALDLLGLDLLSEADARAVLGKRVELSS